MFNDDSKRPAEIARLTADLRAAKVELLSAQCAADRLRLQYSLQDIVSFGERQTLDRAIASVGALNRFFCQIEAQIKQNEEQPPCPAPAALPRQRSPARSKNRLSFPPEKNRRWKHSPRRSTLNCRGPCRRSRATPVRSCAGSSRR